ncbi:hypothetical protein KIN20_000358 [Parelaphostrongylus tenuis]|uniref:C2H2-type domain-containing protein n=1 Tax=Parelaphostrongylus tenuis TaxID=148309 RepID=A0AAD5LW04_PARTN|nr:hypothetical protein KIN20_000358 [Parelaphostrongylus tenuis]
MSTSIKECDSPALAQAAENTHEQPLATAPRHKNNNRQRRRSNTKGEGDGVNSSRSGSRTNSQSCHKANGKRRERDSTRTNSVLSNGDGFEYSDEYELDEPFSDSDDDLHRTKQPQKPNLVIPRGRIRTLSGTVPVVGYSPKWGGPTMCLSCLQFFDLPDQMDQFEEHLLKEHKIVVSEMGLIVDPKRYIEHWRQRFAKESVDKIFQRVEPKEGDKFFGETDYYYNMSETLPEDYSVRQRLAMRRLEEALSCQQREREDTSFQQQCIFCRYTARGNRSKIIHHLYMIHHLNLGSPDNLVFVTEYIEHLKEKLQRNECIYCEKVFGDRNTLMDHMRKRNHREVNPKNHFYDKFYIINYLELGKRWLDVLAEDFEDTMPTFVDSDEEEEDNSWCEWHEDNVDSDEIRVVCLLCHESDDTAEGLLAHMKEKHEFDLVKLIDENHLNVYQRMKLINYIRKQNFKAVCFVCQRDDIGNTQELAKHLQEQEKPIKSLPDKTIWDTEECLLPVFGNDNFLWRLESLLESRDGASDTEELICQGGRKPYASFVAKSQKILLKGLLPKTCQNFTILTMCFKNCFEVVFSVLAVPRILRSSKALQRFCFFPALYYLTYFVSVFISLLGIVLLLYFLRKASYHKYFIVVI